MSANLKHFIITRFNVKFEKIKGDKNSSKVNSLEWLENRFFLFEEYCFPSVLKQTNQNFEWLVFFDVDTPLKYKERISKYSLESKIFKPYFCLNETEFQTILLDIVNKTNINSEFILTTRLDNDDSINELFIETVQKNIEFKENYYIDLFHGVQYDVDKKIYITKKDFNSHFSTRIERNNNNILTLMNSNHREIAKLGIVEYINTEKPMWLEVIHKKNIINDINKRGKVLWERPTFFNTKTLNSISKINSFLFSIKRIVLLIRDSLVFKLKKIVNFKN
jgi:hypothetical protein